MEPQVALEGGWELTGGKTELSTTAVATFFGYNLEGKLIFGGVGWDQKTLEGNGGMPKVSLMNLKLSGGFDLKMPPIDLGNGQKLVLDGKAMANLEFGPNYARLLQMVLTRAMGASFLTLGAAAAAGLVIYSFLDAERIKEFAFKLRQKANIASETANEYGTTGSSRRSSKPAA